MNPFKRLIPVISLLALLSCGQRDKLSLSDGTAVIGVQRNGVPHIDNLDLSGFWRIEFSDGEYLDGSCFPEAPVVRQLSPTEMNVHYRDSLNSVTLNMALEDGRLHCTLEMGITAGDVCAVHMPADLSFDTRDFEYLIYPNELGVKLKKGFFEAKTSPVSWEPVEGSPAHLSEVAGFWCLAGDPGQESPVSITPLGRDILGRELSEGWRSKPRLVVRPSITQPQYELVTSPEGSFWGGHKVGEGLLLRFAGKIRISESALATATVSRTLCAAGAGELAGYDPRGRKKIAVFDIPGSPYSNGWSEISADTWREKLDADWDIVTLLNGDDITHPGDILAVINPYGESMPAVWGEETLGMISRFISEGGIWVETGGYPFFNILEPVYFNSITSHYPFAFSDFFGLMFEAGPVSVYGIQPETSFVPMEFRAWGDAKGGHISRKWKLYKDRDAVRVSPVVVFDPGSGVREAINYYSRANGYSRGLADKVDAAILEKWKRSPIMKISGGTLKEQAALANQLPSPSVIHIWDYLKGGFDKLYPEHLPPHPSKGNMDDFTNLIEEAHSRGNLFMPYTNNTWWCDEPAPGILSTVGSEALLVTAGGSFNREQYGGNYGWSITPWHPAVVESGTEIAAQFAALGADVIFEDQVGAREWMPFDFNPFSPSPDAYQQGIINLAADASRYAPLATEHGFDRLIDYQSEFCGLTWMLVPFHKRPWWLSWWLRSYSDLYAQEDYEAYPLAQYVTDGKAFFTHHLGGPLVENPENLAWTLLLGYRVIIDAPVGKPLTGGRSAWMEYLSRIQREIACHYMGESMLNFEYLDGSGNTGIIHSRFDKVETIANFTEKEYSHGDYTIAPKGFLIQTGEMAAGYLLSVRDVTYNHPVYVIIDKPANMSTIYPIEI